MLPIARTAHLHDLRQHLPALLLLRLDLARQLRRLLLQRAHLRHYLALKVERLLLEQGPAGSNRGLGFRLLSERDPFVVSQ